MTDFPEDLQPHHFYEEQSGSTMFVLGEHMLIMAGQVMEEKIPHFYDLMKAAVTLQDHYTDEEPMALTQAARDIVEHAPRPRPVEKGEVIERPDWVYPSSKVVRKIVELAEGHGAGTNISTIMLLTAKVSEVEKYYLAVRKGENDEMKRRAIDFADRFVAGSRGVFELIGKIIPNLGLNPAEQLLIEEAHEFNQISYQSASQQERNDKRSEHHRLFGPVIGPSNQPSMDLIMKSKTLNAQSFPDRFWDSIKDFKASQMGFKKPWDSGRDGFYDQYETFVSFYYSSLNIPSPEEGFRRVEKEFPELPE